MSVTATILSPNRYVGRIRAIRLIVIHTMEVDEAEGVAVAVANAFANPARQASAHRCVDDAATVLCVQDADTAWAAPGANADGLQIELAGRAGQGADGWADAYSQAVLERAAQECAEWVQSHGIPVRHLSVAELTAGQAGFIGHVDATNAYHQSDHTDPGPDFPWDAFLARVAALVGTSAPAPAPAGPAAPVASGPTVVAPGVPAPAFPLPAGWYFGPKSGPQCSVSGYFSHRADLATWQQRMHDRGWLITVDGLYGPQTASIAHAFQVEKHLTVDSLIGPQTWAAAWTEPVTR